MCLVTGHHWWWCPLDKKSQICRFSNHNWLNHWINKPKAHSESMEPNVFTISTSPHTCPFYLVIFQSEILCERLWNSVMKALHRIQESISTLYERKECRSCLFSYKRATQEEMWLRGWAGDKSLFYLAPCLHRMQTEEGAGRSHNAIWSSVWTPLTVHTLN